MQSMAKHLIVVTCEVSGFQGLYVDGELAHQDDTIYAGDMAEHAKDGPVDLSHVLVVMPDGCEHYPSYFDECLLWLAEGESDPIKEKLPVGRGSETTA